MGGPPPRGVAADRLRAGGAGKLSPVNTVEVLLVLVGIPLAVIVVLALLTLPGGRKRTRYKPGQPWDHAPVWYEPHPEGGSSGGHGAGPGSGAAAMGGGTTAALGSSMYPEQPEERNTDTSSGGGNGTAHGAGSSAHGAGSSAHGATSAAMRPVDAGPLGGARGTW